MGESKIKKLRLTYSAIPDLYAVYKDHVWLNKLYLSLVL